MPKFFILNKLLLAVIASLVAHLSLLVMVPN